MSAETRKPILSLSLGSKFYVEASETERIPVEITGPASWGMVHGWIDLPCQRLDTGLLTTVSVHHKDEVALVEAGEQA